MIKIIMVFKTSKNKKTSKNTYSYNYFAIDTIPIKAFIIYSALQSVFLWSPGFQSRLRSSSRADRETIGQHSSSPPPLPIANNPVLSQRSHTLNYAILQLPNEIQLIKRFLLSCRIVVPGFHDWVHSTAEHIRRQWSLGSLKLMFWKAWSFYFSNHPPPHALSFLQGKKHKRVSSCLWV